VEKKWSSNIKMPNIDFEKDSLNSSSILKEKSSISKNPNLSSWSRKDSSSY
jgi:hypothetical protein